jgi:CMP-N-acetylneuraminic acid synthetase
MSFCGYVTVKLNSERVPEKSIQDLGGRALVNYPLEILSQVDEISKIYLCCSDEKIKGFIDSKWDYCFLKRPAELDSNDTSFNDILDNLISKIAEKYIVFLSCTSPFVQPDTIDEMIRMIKTTDYDSAFLARKIKSFCWYKNQPLNFSPDKIPRTQDLEPIVVETSGLYIFSKNDYMNTKKRVGKKPYIKLATKLEEIDIDTLEDLSLARKIVNAGGR